MKEHRLSPIPDQSNSHRYLDGTYDDYSPSADYEIPNLVKSQVRYFEFTSCQEIYLVRPIRLNYNWHYRGKCLDPECATTWSNLYRIRTLCGKCGKINLVHEKNKFGVCIYCAKGEPPKPDQEPITGLEWNLVNESGQQEVIPRENLPDTPF